MGEIKQCAAMEQVYMEITIAELLCIRMPKVTKGTHASNCQILIVLMECFAVVTLSLLGSYLPWSKLKIKICNKH